MDGGGYSPNTRPGCARTWLLRYLHREGTTFCNRRAPAAGAVLGLSGQALARISDTPPRRWRGDEEGPAERRNGAQLLPWPSPKSPPDGPGNPRPSAGPTARPERACQLSSTKRCSLMALRNKAQGKVATMASPPPAGRGDEGRDSTKRGQKADRRSSTRFPRRKRAGERIRENYGVDKEKEGKRSEGAYILESIWAVLEQRNSPRTRGNAQELPRICTRREKPGNDKEKN